MHAKTDLKVHTDITTSKKRKSSSEKVEVYDKERSHAEKKASSLATVGRAYGNNISKLNVLRASTRPQSAQELREPWHSSSRTESRIYGDYYTWQTSITYLETHRTDTIISKGMKLFIHEYTRKLQRCQIFERGHNVEPFGTARLELLNKGCNGSSVQESLESFASSGTRKNSKNGNVKSLTLSALKTIELIRKYKSGKSIKEDLQVADKKENSTKNQNTKVETKENWDKSNVISPNTTSSGHEVRTSRSKTNKKRSSQIKNLDKNEIIEEETDQQILKLNGKNSDISIACDLGQNIPKNLQEQKTNYSTNQTNLLGVSSVESLQSTGSFDKAKYVKSVKVNSLSIDRRRSE